ncbi:hypothetical protein HGM15179_020506 [Zosterops borbonicus]|uniref:Glycerol kinase n=1 Tax=Zosterops borbonicus TaxID=364589 RepID=A0A8K1D681_9PASS|nr:hypothetical protein HGM15179_020506 [Zosterops borbonicus]
MLDLVVTNKEGLVKYVKLKGSLGYSDHEMVEFKKLMAARRAHSKLTALDFRRADFGLFMDLLGRVPWDKALEGRRAQESWLIFKDCLLQAEEQCIPMKRESSKNAMRPAWINKELLDKLKCKKKVYRELKQGQGIECTLNKFPDESKLCGAVDMLEGKNALQRDIDRWVHVNLMKLNMSKCKVLHLGQGNPTHEYKLGGCRSLSKDVICLTTVSND